MIHFNYPNGHLRTHPHVRCARRLGTLRRNFHVPWQCVRQAHLLGKAEDLAMSSRANFGTRADLNDLMCTIFERVGFRDASFCASFGRKLSDLLC